MSIIIQNLSPCSFYCHVVLSKGYVLEWGDFAGSQHVWFSRLAQWHQIWTFVVIKKMLVDSHCTLRFSMKRQLPQTAIRHRTVYIHINVPCWAPEVLAAIFQHFFSSHFPLPGVLTVAKLGWTCPQLQLGKKEIGINYLVPVWLI